MYRFISGRLLILLALLIPLQYGLAPLLPGQPDFLYLLVLDFAFFMSWERTPFFAAGVGLLKDLLGGHLFGIHTLTLSIMGVLLSLALQKLERENAWVRTAVTFLFVGLSEALSFSLGVWLEEKQMWGPGFFPSVFWTSLYTGLLAPGFFWFTHRWFKRTSFRRQYELF